VQTVTLLIITGIAARYFTKEEFGLWAILISFLYSGYALDFGFRSALTNRLTAMVADSSGNANNKQRDFYLSIFYFQFIIGLAGIVLIFFIGMYIPWGNLLKIQQTSILHYISSLIVIIFVILFLNAPLLCSSSGFSAYHEVHIDSLLHAAQWIILMCVFGVINIYKMLSFPTMIILFFIVFFLLGFIRLLVLFKHRKWVLIWLPIKIQLKNVKDISRVSLDFFLLNISAMTVSMGGTFLAGYLGGLVSAGDFSVVQRLFTVLITAHMAFMSGFVPSFTQNARQGNWEGVLKRLNFNLYLIVPLLFIVLGGVIFAFHPFILKIWTGLSINDYFLTGLFALYALLMGWGNTNSILLNSLGLVKSQALWSFAIAPIFLFLTFYFGKTLGVEGVALASVISAIPGTIYFTLYTRKAIREKLINV
jgi:O-antigen/teichoic acid export membrane protein